MFIFEFTNYGTRTEEEKNSIHHYTMTRKEEEE